MTNLTQDKAIRIESRPLIPREIIESDKSLSVYLEENKKQNRENELARLRYMKASRTRKYNLEQKTRQITVEPSNGSEPIQQQRKTWKCKPVTEPREGSVVVSTIKGIVTVCSNCGHRWVHHSSKLSSQYYCQCPRCRRNIRLKHYQ